VSENRRTSAFGSLTERGSDQAATGARSDAPVVGETPVATRSVSENRRTSALFDPAYAEPVDPTTQIARIPGTPDAPCHCGEPVCRWPFNPQCWSKELDDDRRD
jgi:hypothetical protein